jgi:hypothetical protein
MKKLLLILAIAILFLSCEKEEIETCTYSCNAWVKEEGMTRTVIQLDFDCQTNEPINLPVGYIFLGCDNDNTP